MSFCMVFLFSLFSHVADCSALLPIRSENTSSLTSHGSEAEAKFKQGWTSAPNGRGTIDIFWSCGFTMCLCSWSILCLNVPGPDDSRFKIFRRKLYMTALAFLGPEFIFQIALGQWVSARRSVKEFHASGYTQWTITHAFYADMGGFMLQTKDWVSFPIDAKQLHYLVIEGYIEYPKIDKAGIADKNKVDGLLRILTLIQIVWFVISMAGRAAQGLAITCGELTTAAFIVCSIGTTVCWIYKPADVARPEYIYTKSSISEILINAGEAACAPYSRTPLDFVSRKEWHWSLYWSNWINILRNLGIVFGPQTRPVNRIENTTALELPGAMNYVFLAMSALYTGIFCCGWKYSFPTHIETILWRVASITMVGTLVAYWAITNFAFVSYPFVKGRWTRDAVEISSGSEKTKADQGWLITQARAVAACVRNNSVSKDPALRVPLKAILPIYVVGVLYCHARTYIFIGDIIQLRSLPASAYETVDWLQFAPHF